MRTSDQKGSRGAGYIISRVVLAVALFAVAVALLASTAFYIFPLSIAEGRLRESFRKEGALVSWQSMGRTFPFGLKASGVEVVDISSGRPVLRLEEARVRLALLSLLSGRLKFPINVRVGDGVVSGEARVDSDAASLDLASSGIDAGSMLVLQSMGVGTKCSVGGTLSLRLPYKGCPTGTVRLRSGRIDSRSLRFMGLPLALGNIEQAGLNAELKSCKVVVEGLWLDGDELSAKLAGEMLPRNPIGASPLNMTLEVTPKGDFSEKHWLFSLLSQYRKSSNYYFMTIRGTVTRPVVGR